MIGHGAVPSHLHVTVEASGEQATFLPHYFSTSCFHERHLQCKGRCKFCPEKCRCDCHEAPAPSPDEQRFGGGKYRIHRGETLEVPTADVAGLKVALRAYPDEVPRLRCWPKPGEPDTTVVSWTGDPGAET